MELEKSRGEIRTPHISCFPVLCHLVKSTLWAGGLAGCWPVSEALVIQLACIRMAELAGTRPGETSRHNPISPPLSTHLATAAPVVFMGHTLGSDHMEIWVGGGGLSRPVGGRRTFTNSEWFVARLQGWVKEEPSKVKRQESWENSRKAIQKQWSFLRLLSRSRNILMHLPSSPLGKGHPWPSAEEYIPCSHHFGCNLYDEVRVEWWILTSDFLEKSLKFMTSDILFFNLSLEKKKKKEKNSQRE